MDDKVAVIITITSFDKYFFECLDSICLQTVKPYEVIVVADGIDKDNSHNLESYFNKLPLQVFFNPERRGGNYSRNKGVSISSSDILLFLDGDDIFHPQKVEMLTSAFLNNVADVIYHPARVFSSEVNGSYITQPDSEVTLVKLLSANIIGATSMVSIRKSFLVNLDSELFDITFPALQDWDSWINLFVHNAIFLYLDVPLTNYRVVFSEASVSKSIAKNFEAQRLMNCKYAVHIELLDTSETSSRVESNHILCVYKMMLNNQRLLACKFIFIHIHALKSRSFLRCILMVVLGRKLGFICKVALDRMREII